MLLWRPLALVGAGILLALVIVLSQIRARACCDRYPTEPPWKRGLHLREWHHGWLVVLAFAPWWPVQLVGLVLGADDLLGQHVWHLSRKHAQHRSPLHHLARVTWYPLRRRLGWE